MPLFAFEEVVWANFALNLSTVLLIAVQLWLHGKGWRRRNGWHPPDPDRRSGRDRRHGDPPA